MPARFVRKGEPMEETRLAAISENKNSDLAPAPQPGDMIRVARYLVGEHVYDHYGIYVGSDKVIHFARKSGRLFGEDPAIVFETTLERFLDGSREFEVVRFLFNTKTPEEVVATAYGCIGEMDYNVVFNNCEHFARFCKTGRRTSEQVIRIGTQLAVGLFALAMQKSGGSGEYGIMKLV